ncbi:MAG: sugar O-acyltransferase (sialic acid O-acetyltransferase NeuD family) [Enterobacterales bacterium]
MPNQCIVIGCGSHASAIISIIESSIEGYEIIGLADIADNYDPSEKKSGYKVILSLQELLNLSDKYTHLYCVLAIGDNAERKIIFDKLLSKNFKFPNIISHRAFVDRTVTMGDGNVIAHNSVINAKAKLGVNNLINTGAIIEHHCCIKSHAHIAPRALLCGGVKISDSVFIGAGATIFPHVFVEESSIVGAGALLITNILEKKSTFLGMPAKVKIR